METNQSAAEDTAANTPDSGEVETQSQEERSANAEQGKEEVDESGTCLLYTSPSPRDRQKSRMPSSA